MISIPELNFRLCHAVVLGALLGLDQIRVEPAAGPRTHALVALASALLPVSSEGCLRIPQLPHAVLDPSRTATQRVSGTGFLGAGVLLLRRETEPIRTLTTAASLWLVAAIGLAVGRDCPSAPWTRRCWRRRFFGWPTGWSSGRRRSPDDAAR